jgi:hypothetical protein
MTGRWAVPALLAVIALSACTAPKPGGHAQASFEGTLATSVDYDSVGIHLRPPTAFQAAGTARSWSDALATCDTVDAVCPTDRSGTIVLAVVSSPTLQPTLAYVMTWTGIPCSPAGPGPTSSVCTYISIVDANTLAVLTSLSGPHL